MHIAIHLEAPHKPKAIKAAARLKMQPLEFILQVMAPVWIFAAMNNDGSGDVTGLDDDVLSSITFGRCSDLQVLIETGWLRIEDGVLQVPRWLEHEPYFGERARDRQRKRTERRAKDGKSQGSPTESHGLPALEEKRVEEKIQLPLPDKSGESVKSKRIEYSDIFEQFWRHVPSDKKSGKGAAYKVWQRLSAEDRLKAVDRMEWTAGCFEALDPGRQRIQYLTDPQGWLNQRKFEDADEAVKLVARGK